MEINSYDKQGPALVNAQDTILALETKIGRMREESVTATTAKDNLITELRAIQSELLAKVKALRADNSQQNDIINKHIDANYARYHP